MSSFTIGIVATLFLELAVSLAAAEPHNQWPRWRGPHDDGSVEAGSYPVKWDATKVLWKANLPGKGSSTPIVWARHIFLTAPAGGLDAVLGFDWAGKALWQKTLGPERSGNHRNGSGSNPSPATDGKAIFVYFKSGQLAALGLDGQLRWQTNLAQAFGQDTLYWDQGTSPVLTEQDVVIARMHTGASWLAAFDKISGQLHWRVDRNYETPLENDQAYTTPVVIEQEGRQAILVWGAEHLTAHDAAQGKLLWSCGGDFNPPGLNHCPAVASPVVAGDIVVIASSRADHGQPRLQGIRLGGRGDVTTTHRLWKREDIGTYVPTPAIYRGRVYLLGDRGQVDCLEAANGKSLWQAPLPKTSANYYASPLIAAGKLYAAREDGVVFVADITDKFELFAENKLDESIVASPVAVENRLLLRGERHLFCIAIDDSPSQSGQ